MKQRSHTNAQSAKRFAPGHRTWFFIACGVYLLATGIVLGPTLFSSQSLVLSRWGDDMIAQFLAWRDFGFSELRAGHLALWNPYLFSGAPFLGGFQSALLYPPNWLYLILPLPVAINVGIALHVVLAGIAMYCWAAHHRLHPVAPILAGLIFMFGGTYFLHIYPGHLTNLCAMVWAPFIFLSIDRLTSERGWSGAWIGSAAVAMQVLAGHPQYVFYAAVIAGVYTLLRLRHAPRQWHALLGCLLVYAAGAALSGAQLVTGLQATHESVRHELSQQVAGSYALAPENLLTLIAPSFFGLSSDTLYWGRWIFWEECLYVGVAAVALALFGLARDRASHRRGVVGATSAALLLAMGYYTPLFHLIYHIPGFASFRGLSKFAFLFAMFVAFLAALGFDWLIRREKLSPRPSVIVAALGAVSLLLALAIYASASNPEGWWFSWVSHLQWSSDNGRIPVAPPFVVVTSLAHHAASQLLRCGVLFLLVALLFWAARYRRFILYGVVVLACIELVAFAMNYTISFPMEKVDQLTSAWQGLLAQTEPDARIFSSEKNLLLLMRGHDLWGNDPMVIGRYGQFVARSQGEPVEDLFMKPFPHLDSPMLRMGRLEYVYTPAGGLNRAPWPTLKRAQFISRYRVISDSAARLETLADPAFDSMHKLILETPPNPAPAGDPGDNRVELLDRSSDRIEVKASVLHPSILLITDTYSSGWHIHPLEANPPQQYQVLPADHAFRAIPLAAGEHHFLLEYQPVAWIVGKWVSIVAIVIYALLGARKLQLLKKFRFV